MQEEEEDDECVVDDDGIVRAADATVPFKKTLASIFLGLIIILTIRILARAVLIQPQIFCKSN
jgi:hypothetical protein